eukprot:6199468-Pleurochrysis_carterae.AAC.4
MAATIGGACSYTANMPLSKRVHALQQTPFGVLLDNQDLRKLARAGTICRLMPRRTLPPALFTVVLEGEAEVLSRHVSIALSSVCIMDAASVMHH